MRQAGVLAKTSRYCWLIKYKKLSRILPQSLEENLLTGNEWKFLENENNTAARVKRMNV